MALGVAAKSQEYRADGLLATQARINLTLGVSKQQRSSAREECGDDEKMGVLHDACVDPPRVGERRRRRRLTASSLGDVPLFLSLSLLTPYRVNTCREIWVVA